MTASKRSFFYKKLSVTASAFPDEPQLKFGFDATRVIIVNDHEDSTLTWSFLNPNIDGELFCADGPISFEGISEGRLWLKTSFEGSAQVRVWAWRI